MMATQAMRILGLTKMRPMTTEEMMGFQGCESLIPLIGEYEEPEAEIPAALLVLDYHASDRQYRLEVFYGEGAERGKPESFAVTCLPLEV